MAQADDAPASGGPEAPPAVGPSSPADAPGALHILQYSMPGVLHYLQMEWRRFEIERTEWELERAQLKSRIAVLEGERKGLTALQADLQRRMQMLEYALKQERLRHVGSAAPATQPTPLAPPAPAGGPNPYATLLNYSKGFGTLRSRELLTAYLREANSLTLRSGTLAAAAYPEKRRGSSSPANTGSDVPSTTTALSDVKRPTGATMASELKVPTLPPSGRLQPSPSTQTTVLGSSPSAADALAALSLSAAEASDPDTNPRDRTGRRGGRAGSRASAERVATDDAGTSRLQWSAAATFRGHLGASRAVTWVPRSPFVCTGSDEGVVRIWNATLASSPAAETSPVVQLRAQASPVTAVAAVATAKSILVAAAQAASVRVWTIPQSALEPGDAYAPALAFDEQELVGHSDLVWDISARTCGDGTILLATAAADGSVKVWKAAAIGKKFSTSATLRYDAAADEASQEPEMQAPTCVRWDPQSERRLWAGYRNRTLLQWDVSQQRPASRIPGSRCPPPDGIAVDATARQQLYRFALHPVLPLLVAGYEDRTVRWWDIQSGQCLHSMVAHMDGVAALDLREDGDLLATGGHDRSLRLWSVPVAAGEKGVQLTGAPVCVQEMTCHRQRFDEAILAVSFSRRGLSSADASSGDAYLASAGADGIVKVFTLKA